MKIDLKDNIRLTIAFILLIAVLLWVCNKNKWRNKKEPQETINKGLYACSMSGDLVFQRAIIQHDK